MTYDSSKLFRELRRARRSEQISDIARVVKLAGTGIFYATSFLAFSALGATIALGVLGFFE